MANPPVISEEAVFSALRGVNDPELEWNIVDLGLVYRVGSEEGRVEVDFTLTYPGCPAEDYLRAEIEGALRRAFGTEPRVAVVWRPLWGPERMSEEARVSLGFPI
jgi:metal-sulfur cluster biosynthetic enzyme